jgi:hypothetical protein
LLNIFLQTPPICFVGKADEIKNIMKKYGKVIEVEIKDGPKSDFNYEDNKLGILTAKIKRHFTKYFFS